MAGRSVRFGTTLAAEDILAAGEILKLMGVENPVRSRIAQGYAPAEVWALWVYSLAKHWSIGLTIVSVYDKDQKTARVSEHLIPAYDHVGQLVAGLDMTTAHTVLQLVDRSCPSYPEQLLQEPVMRQATSAVKGAIEAVWHMIASVRGSNTRLEPSGQPADAVAVEDDTWVQIVDGPLNAYARVAAVQERVIQLLQQWPTRHDVTWIESFELLAMTPDTDWPGQVVAYVRRPNRGGDDGDQALQVQAAIAQVLGCSTKLLGVSARKDLPADAAGVVLPPTANTSILRGPVKVSMNHLWASLLRDLRAHIPPAQFDTWLKELALLVVDCAERRVVVGVSNVFAREKIERQYMPQLHEALARVFGMPLAVEVHITQLRERPLMVFEAGVE